MPVESATYINDLNSSYPISGESMGEGDDHLRLIKLVLKNTFPNIFSAVTATAAELNQLSGTTITAFAKTLLDDVDAAAARLTLAAAARGANSDITSLSGLTTPLSISQGGTGASTAAAAIAALVAPGASGNVMTSNGTTWISAAPPIGQIDIQTFNYTGGNQTWTKPSFGTIAIIECWGGGGSGAKTNSSGNAAGGGGGGNYVMRILPLSALNATETVYVGAGGVGVSGVIVNGNDGQNTTFGSHVTAHGGGRGLTNGKGGGGGAAGTGGLHGRYGGGNGGGYAESSVVSVPTGSTFGGGGGGGDLGANGADSMFGGAGGGCAWWNGSGSGGTSLFGGNGGNGAKDTNAQAGSVPGGGGGGCFSTNSGHTSGAGGHGWCRVTVF